MGSDWSLPWIALGTLGYRPHVEAVPGEVGEIESALRAGAAAPLAWELYYEALDLQVSAPRAAFVVGFTAAEVGVKQFGGRRSTSERWLLEKVQSPPMDALLSQYLPPFVDIRVRHTRSKNKEQCIPDDIRSVLGDAAVKRNKVVHSPRGFDSEFLPPRPDMTRLLAAVGDLLYLLDWFAGISWAFDYLSEGVCAAFAPDADPRKVPAASASDEIAQP